MSMMVLVILILILSVVGSSYNSGSINKSIKCGLLVSRFVDQLIVKEDEFEWFATKINPEFSNPMSSL